MAILGYNTQGASQDTQWDANDIMGSKFAMADGGNTIQLHMWYHTYGAMTIYMAIYADNSGAPAARIGAVVSAAIGSTGGTPTQADISCVRSLAIGTYWIGFGSDNNALHTYFDTGAANQGVFNYNPGTGLTDPFDATGITYNTNKWSVWADYTPAAGGLSIPVAMHHYAQMRGL